MKKSNQEFDICEIDKKKCIMKELKILQIY